MAVGPEVVARLEGSYRCTVGVRQFSLTCDEPFDQGGSDQGPMPTELLLASVAACFAMSVAHVARREGLEVPDLVVRAWGEYEGPRFSRIRIEVDAALPDRARLGRLISKATRYCYVSNTLRGQPELEFAVAQGSDESPGPPPAGPP